MKCFKIFACLTLSIAMLAGGCASSTSPASSSGTEYRAVVASGGNGSPTVFLIPVGAAPGTKSMVLAPAGKPICAGCRAEADKYFETGQMAAIERQKNTVSPSHGSGVAAKNDRKRG